MLKLSIAAMMITAGSASAATYTFDEANGDYIDSVYGSRDDIFQLYQDEMAFNVLEYEACEDALLLYPNALDNCDAEMTRFEQYRAHGDALTFDEFYDLHFEGAVNDMAIQEWRTDGLTVNVSNFFPYSFQQPYDGETYLGVLEAPGDGVGPRRATFTLTGDEEFVSIDLMTGRLGIPMISADNGRISQVLPEEFSGTFYFDGIFAGVRSFELFVGITDQLEQSGLAYTNLISTNAAQSPVMAEVPLPATLPALALGLLAIMGLRRRRRG